MPVYRKKRPLHRTTATLRDARLIVVATEGQETEKVYFSGFQSPRLHIHVVACEDGKSAPQHVLERLARFKSDYELAGDDQLWLVVDVDRWRDRTLSEVAAECNRSRINLAVSNPCFELWVALHLPNPPPDNATCDELVAHLRRELGSYRKSNFDVTRVLQGLDTAIARARTALDGTTDRWPQRMGTSVYKLAEQIRAM
jgi:hypothetical protein